jgi:hypothetical protein
LEEPVLGGPAHAISPAADSDPGIVGGPIESLVVTAGSSSAFGTAHPAAGTPATTGAGPARAGAQPGDGLDPPAVHRWDGTVPGAGSTGEAGGLRLWSTRKLYSPGVVVTHSAAVSNLAEEDFARLHPDEFDRLGLASGAPVTVTSPGGSVTVPAEADAAVPAGVVWITSSAGGGLIDAATVTTVSVEVGVGG